MFNMDRRSVIKGGAALGAAGAAGLLDFAKAWAQPTPFKPEPDAKISMLRWKRFVEAEDAQFMKIVEAFTKATGVKVNISNESFDDIQPKASVAANTGQGPDMVWGLHSLPHLFPDKCLDGRRRRRLSRQEIWRLGAGRRGYRPEQGQVDRHPGRVQRRLHQLPHRRRGEGGLQGVPEGHGRLPRALQGA